MSQDKMFNTNYHGSMMTSVKANGYSLYLRVINPFHLV